MTFYLDNHDKGNAVRDLLLSLFPDEGHQQTEGQADCVSSLHTVGDNLVSRAVVRRGDTCHVGEWQVPRPTEEGEEYKRRASFAVKTALYHGLLPFLPAPPPWGSMTGVKPAKPARLAYEGGMSWEDIPGYMTQTYYAEPVRADLLTQAARHAAQVYEGLQPRECQLYIGIPFCPAKCSYCSFVSNDTARSGHLIAPYLAALHQEIAAAGRMASSAGLRIGSLYLGGGTPTVLTAAQLDGLLAQTASDFDLSRCCEITVEAGRPETITRDKLAVMMAHRVTRISINPQTMDDRILAGVGRHHTAEDVRNALALVRRIGAFSVNMDLIAGLPGDSAAGLLDSCRQLIGLGAENITLHSLARKRGAPMFFGSGGQLKAADMDACYNALSQGGYAPYYLYRQKYTAGMLENTGWCLPDLRGYYNICMMEELCDVIALGAGGVTKLTGIAGAKIRRISNPKYPKEYIEGIEAIIRGKSAAALDMEDNP